jgi:hypothetical protein
VRLRHPTDRSAPTQFQSGALLEVRSCLHSREAELAISNKTPSSQPIPTNPASDQAQSGRIGVGDKCFQETELSLQLRVLPLGLLQDGDVGVGVFPEREEIFICTFGLGGVACNYVSATELEI